MNSSVAIVGTGIAGLSCGYLLSQEGARVSVFEIHDEIGMDAHCVHVENKDGELSRLNTPPRSFSKAYYPNLMELYRVAGVEIENWSWAWTAFYAGEYNPFIRMSSRRFMGYPLPSHLDILRPWRTIQMWMDGYRFTRAVRYDYYHSDKLRKMTLGEYIEHLGLSEAFLTQGLLPTLAMVCTCSYESCLNYPAVLVMEFFAKTSTFGQYRTKYGTQDAVRHLLKDVKQKKLGVRVTKVFRKKNPNDKVRLEYQVKKDGSYVVEEFDHVVMASQANHAVEILQGLSKREIDLLKSFKHETSTVVIHRDERVMPGNPGKWSPMSIGISNPTKEKKYGESMFTIYMNDSFPYIKGNLFQTWNPIIPIDEKKIIDQPIVFERPIMTKESLESVIEIKTLQGYGGVWFCGSWNAFRIPLQESGVISALDVVEGMFGRKTIVGNFPTKEEHDMNEEQLWETKLFHSSSQKGIFLLALLSATSLLVFTTMKK